MTGQAPFWRQLGLLQCSLGLLQCFLGLHGLHFYAFGEQPGFEAAFGVPPDMLD